VSFEHLALKAAFNANDVVGTHRASDRHCRNTGRFFDDIIAKTAQCRMDRIDQAGDFVGRDEVLSHIRRHDLARAALLFGVHGRRNPL
jgi:hypothetical protein